MKRIITGCNGLLGSAMVRCMQQNSYDYVAYNRNCLDLCNTENVLQAISNVEEDVKIYNFAAKVGGLYSNMKNQYSYLDQNIKMSSNVINAMISRNRKNDKLVQILSTCIYPDKAYVTYPMTEDQLHLGPPHTSNYGYAYAKRISHTYARAATEQHGCNIISVIPNNLFGKNDRFSIEDGHVIPALIKKFLDAKHQKVSKITVLGDGTPLREFTYSDDAAKIIELLMQQYDSSEPINIGCTMEYSIKQLVTLICEYLEYDGDIVYDTSKSNGQHRKPTSNKRLLEYTDWSNSRYTPFEHALRETCLWASENYVKLRS